MNLKCCNWSCGLELTAPCPLEGKKCPNCGGEMKNNSQ